MFSVRNLYEDTDKLDKGDTRSGSWLTQMQHPNSKTKRNPGQDEYYGSMSVVSEN